MYIYTYIYQRKLGSNTSEVRTNRILSLEMMKGGARWTLDLEKGGVRLRLDWERVVRHWHLTLKGGVKGGVRLRLDLEGWCETSHDLDEGWLQIGLRLDLEGCCAIETWPWRVLRDWDLTLKGAALTLKGGVRLRLDLEGWCAIETWPWWRVVADRIVKAAWMLHGQCCGEEARARNLVFFRVKWMQPAMKGTSCVRRVRLGSFGSFYVFCNDGCSCVRSSVRLLKLWLQIALEWLHECCMGNVVGRKPEHETLCFSV